MKRSLSLTGFLSLFFVFLLMHGCATGPEITKLTGLWKFDKYSGGHLDKVLVVGKPRIDENRIKYEDYMTKILEKKDIDMIPSYTVIPDMKDLNRANIRKAAHDTGVKAVLVMRVVGIDEKNVIFQQTPEYRYTVTPRGTYMTAYAFSGERVEKLIKVRIESGLFEVESEKLLWAATSSTINPESADEAIKDYSKAVIQQLKKDGYIK